MKKKKLGFALGAGGSRGVAHIGFLKAMEENKIKPDYITGCSMGSVIGSAYSAGLDLEYIKNAVFKLRLLDLISASGRRGGLFDMRKIRKLLEKHMGDIEFADLKIPFHCIAADMVTQKIVEFSEGKVLDGVLASSCIPAIFNPIEMDDKRLIDGGVIHRVPYEEVRNMGAEVVVAVDVLGRLDCSEKMPTTLGVLLETLDLMDNLRTQNCKQRDKHLYDFWLEPELGRMNQYSLKQVEFAYEKGYEIGCKYAPDIKKALK